jgi:hypothetical protein
METPLQRARTVARRDLNARTAASVARYAVPAARKKTAAKKIQSQVRRRKATRKANVISNARIPSQITALSNKVSELIPKDLNRTVSSFLVKPAGKTRKVNKNKKGGDAEHPYHHGGMGCGSHGYKKPRKIGKPTKKKIRKGKY